MFRGEPHVHAVHHGWEPYYSLLAFIDPKEFNNSIFTFITDSYVWLLMLGWVAQMGLTLHIWNPENERLAFTDRLFIQPLYCSGTLEQSLLLNRRRWDKEHLSRADRRRAEDFSDNVSLLSDMTTNTMTSLGSLHSDFGSIASGLSSRDQHRLKRREKRRKPVPNIYACATMWHETEEEMKQIMRSIYRMDYDRSVRYQARNVLGVEDPDYYDFGVHIFFDDAFDFVGKGEMQTKVNQYVEQLIKVVPEAASAIHKADVVTQIPHRIPTPYGGRLVWKLPGGTYMNVHLKDKSLIRHKKRWSQVMYMYYLLGFHLVAQEEDKKQRERQADNTFILALDGDVDFGPDAVLLLVDLMKKDKKVGAACGRIHPVGTGPLAWYQVFEYSVGHWLQKATEHILGCVLCSPGCFSLFRASALMDDNVMRTYTTKSSEARHFVQYDQGEDRWLCTLLLQQGYRVEYSAASDSFTFCPMEFKEFFNQRRRWGPSTMANILDLLQSFKQTVRKNDNISVLYMLYQMFLFATTILGPSTILLMIAGALASTGTALVRDGLNSTERAVRAEGATQDTDIWVTVLVTLVVVVYIIVCYKCKPDTQIRVAQYLTIVFMILMMLVVVGTLKQTIADFGSPASLFLFFLVGVFLITCLLHPQEFWGYYYGVLWCGYGLIYFVSIPCMYLLLIIYGFCNLHVVSWGTREVKTEPAEGEAPEPEPAPKEEIKKKMGAMQYMKLVGSRFVEKVVGPLDEEKAVLIQEDSNGQMNALSSQLSVLSNQINSLQQAVYSSRLASTDSGRSVDGASIDRVEELEDADENEPLLPPDLSQEPSFVAHAEGNEKQAEPTPSVVKQEKRDVMNSPYWLNQEQLKDFPESRLDSEEITFWEDLIKEYLYPLKKDKKEEEKVGEQLIELRNNISFAFFLINALWMVLVFSLQLSKETIGFNYKVEILGTVLVSKIEPLGIAFSIIFFILLLLQLLCMMAHRYETICHIMATTSLVDAPGADSVQSALNLVSEMSHLGTAFEEEKNVSPGRKRKTFKGWNEEAAKPGGLENAFTDMKDAFEYRISLLVGALQSGETDIPENLMHRKSMAFLDDQKEKILARTSTERRHSLAGGLRRPSYSDDRRQSFYRRDSLAPGPSSHPTTPAFGNRRESIFRSLIEPTGTGQHQPLKPQRVHRGRRATTDYSDSDSDEGNPRPGAIVRFTVGADIETRPSRLNNARKSVDLGIDPMAKRLMRNASRKMEATSAEAEPEATAMIDNNDLEIQQLEDSIPLGYSLRDETTERSWNRRHRRATGSTSNRGSHSTDNPLRASVLAAFKQDNASNSSGRSAHSPLIASPGTTRSASSRRSQDYTNPAFDYELKEFKPTEL